MQRMLFGNPVFKKGLNFTVRLGDKWKSLSIGEFIEIEGWSGFAEIRKLYICDLASIPPEVFQCEHDPACRDWASLVKVLKTVYPDLQDMDSEKLETQVITCVGFFLYSFHV